MITNELLQIKYDTQKRQDQEAGHDLKRYMEITHRNVQKAAAAYGLKLKYRTPDKAAGALSETENIKNIKLMQ